MRTTIVVKLGGELLAPERRAEAEAIAADIAALVREGLRVVVVHGGGPQTTALQRRLGQEVRMVGGRRVTDDDALDAIKMVVAGKLNVELTALLGGAGVRAIGLHGASGRVIAAEKRPARVVAGGGPDPVDFGHVGDVVGVDRALLDHLASGGLVPVMACIGCDAAGRVFNINADTVANGVARALGAERLVMITSAPGVLRDVGDPTSRIPRLTRADAERAIVDGVIAGGMIPKVEESFEALAAGVEHVHVVGHLTPGDLAREIHAPGSVGTVLEP
jgi:acetylglutamate kinase